MWNWARASFGLRGAKHEKKRVCMHSRANYSASTRTWQTTTISTLCLQVQCPAVYSNQHNAKFSAAVFCLSPASKPRPGVRCSLHTSCTPFSNTIAKGSDAPWIYCALRRKPFSSRANAVEQQHGILRPVTTALVRRNDARATAKRLHAQACG